MLRPAALALFLAAAVPALPDPAPRAAAQQSAQEGGAQDAPPAEPPEDDPAYDPRIRPPLMQYREQRAAEIAAQLEGAWRMTRYIRPEEALTDTNVEGITIFRQGYGSTIVHAASFNPDFQGFEEFFQATAFRYRIDEALRLQTSTVIGHRMLDDQLEVDMQLEPREFNVEVLGDTLILTRPDGTRLQYQRLVSDAFPEKTLLLIQQQRGSSVTPVPGPGEIPVPIPGGD